jgi:energy-coupling factor transporter ATP-binding protein EcfA2
LGYVPQGDGTIYKSLTVRRLLTYSDRLRRPRDRRSGRQGRIKETCENLAIAPQLDQPVHSLSGGERRRVSIALEILAEPNLLMLDEPTSGLDAAKDLEVMTLLRAYAKKPGRSVITVTHNTEHLDLADQVLVVVKGGRPVHLGPPGTVLIDLGADSYTTLMSRLDLEPGPPAATYQTGPAAETARRKAEELRHAVSLPGSSKRPPSARPRRAAGRLWRQLPVLIQRQFMLTINRAAVRGGENGLKRLAAHLAPAMPLIIAIVGALVAAAVVSGDNWSGAPKDTVNASARTALSLLVTLTMLGGQALAYSDVVAEYAVIHREHRTGVLPSAVILSKWAIFAIIAVLQAILVTITFVMVKSSPERSNVLGPTVELGIDLIATSIAAMSSGLLISVVAKRLEQAVALATGTAIAQVALSGGLASLDGRHPLQALAFMLPARWGFGASASSIDLRGIARGTPPDATWNHTTGQWTGDLALLGCLTIFYTMAAIFVLRRRLGKRG